MIDLTKIKKYFTYNDNLRIVVSIITGIIIVIFNIVSGFMIIKILFSLLFGIYHPPFWVLFLYIIPGIAVGAGILRVCILFLELMLGGIEIEEYSYLRLVLLVTIIIYFLILILYSVFQIYQIH